MEPQVPMWEVAVCMAVSQSIKSTLRSASIQLFNHLAHKLISIGAFAALGLSKALIQSALEFQQLNGAHFVFLLH